MPATPTTPTSDPTAADRLHQLDRPTGHLWQVVDEGPIGRLYARPELHRAIPLGVAVRLARARGRLEWAVARRRRRNAVRRAGLLAGPGASRREVRRLARAHLVELAIQTELSWHPARAGRMPVRGLEHLERACAGGKGVILATAHMGPMLNLPRALAARGYRLYLTTGYQLGEPLRGHHGRWVKTQSVSMEAVGCRWVRRGDSYEVLRSLLERGELCWMAWDIPGDSELPVRLLGRAVRVARGTAQLALQTGAPVVPGFAWREGNGQVGALFDAIDPRQVEGEEELNARVAAAVEAALAPRLAQAHMRLAQREWWSAP